MDVSGIGRPLQLPGTIDNGDVKVTKAYELNTQKENSRVEKTTPAVIRHTSDDTLLSNGLKNEGIAEMYRNVNLLGRKETPLEIDLRERESLDIYRSQLPSIAVDMRRGLDQLMMKLSEEYPNLANDKWGFSVEPNGDLVVTGELSKQDEKTLTELLNKNDGLKLLASEFSELLVKGMELDRGPYMVSQGKAKFDLTADNFSEIIDLRKYLDAPFTGKYAQGYQSLVDKNNIIDLYRVEGNFELGDQLASKAEMKYNKGIIDKYDFETGEWNRVGGEDITHPRP